MPTVTLTPTGCLQLTRTETFDSLDVNNKAVKLTGPVTHCMGAGEVAAMPLSALMQHVERFFGRELSADELGQLQAAKAEPAPAE